jgi:hypothetical protein
MIEKTQPALEKAKDVASSAYEKTSETVEQLIEDNP